MPILQFSLPFHSSQRCISPAISSSWAPQNQFLSMRPSTIFPSSIPYKTTPIRMGGGPRTYPGGVSKWQWKRMQANKAKQLLKARLARERQIYEMRKRAELKAAVSELERPWETVERPPNLFSVSADEQLKVLADRFQTPGGLDLWSENDGPQLFRPDNGLPSARFFPKGVVHSIKPYGKNEDMDRNSDESLSWDLDQYVESGGSSRGSNPKPNSEKGAVRKDERRNLDGKIRDTNLSKAYRRFRLNNKV